MEIETVAVIASAITYWRAVLGLVSAAAMSAWLVQTVSWFTGAQAITFTIAGFFVGSAWDHLASNKEAKARPAATSPAVAYLTSSVVGFCWGAASSSSMPAIVAGIPVLLACVFAWHKVATARQWLATSTQAKCAVITAATYLSTAIFIVL